MDAAVSQRDIQMAIKRKMFGVFTIKVQINRSEVTASIRMAKKVTR